MKKWISLLVSTLLVFALTVTFATADATEVTAKEEGYENILFSNDYRGFCVDEGLQGAKVSDVFTVRPASEITNNKNGQNVSNQLKVMMTKGFHSFFEKDLNGRYGITQYGLQLAQRVAWYYTDHYVSENYKTDIEQLVAQIDEWVADGVTVANEGACFAVDDTTNIQMDFVLLNTQIEGQQCFFGYKMTQTPNRPVLPSQPEESSHPEPPSVVTPTEPSSQPTLPPVETPTEPSVPDPVVTPAPGVPGEYVTVSTVSAPQTPTDSDVGTQAIPQTGDAGSLGLSVALGCVAALGLLLLPKRKSR